MTEKKLAVFSAVGQELGRLSAPIYLRYDIARIAWAIYKLSEYGGRPLQRHKEELDAPAFRRIEKLLLENGLIKPATGLPTQSAYLLAGANERDPMVLACAIDPFCYVSHLSAMEFHGLTNRLPENLYISSPPPKDWKALSAERMRRDLDSEVEAFLAAKLPTLARTRLEKVVGRVVHRYVSSNRGAFKIFKSPNIRMATIGRTFLDMLREPDLCGGLTHVLDVFLEHGKKYLNLILDEVDQHGLDIDKVRTGFILEEMCGIRTNPRIETWTQFAKRGGSRKLDPSQEYSSDYSERWCLSINTILPTA